MTKSLSNFYGSKTLTNCQAPVLWKELKEYFLNITCDSICFPILNHKVEHLYLKMAKQYLLGTRW